MEDNRNENVLEKFASLLKEETENIGHANILIAGKSGVGKHTLINAAFREDLTTSESEFLVTKYCKMIQKDGVPLRIYATVGLEFNQQTQTESINEIRSLIQTKIQQNNPDEFIHCLWYCIQANSKRLDDAELNFIKEIAKNIPVVLVLTKNYFKEQAETLRAILKNYNLPVKNIIVVLTSVLTKDGSVKDVFWVNQLVDFTCSILPESVQKAWINAQQASLRMKKEKAMNIVIKTSIDNFSAKFLPIPFLECIVLPPIQLAMMAQITTAFGLTLHPSFISGIFHSLIGLVDDTLSERTFISSLLKMLSDDVIIEDVSSISGTTASLLTIALGKTYIEILEMIFKGEIDEKNINSESIREKINEMIKENMD